MPVPEQMDDNSNLTNLMETLDSLIQKFTPKQAIVFILKEAFQFQSKEIASLLETTETAVKSILHRAKKHIDKKNGPLSALIFSWDEKEKQLLLGIFSHALRANDPKILIQSIPSIRFLIFNDENKKISKSIRSSTSKTCFCAFSIAS